MCEEARKTAIDNWRKNSHLLYDALVCEFLDRPTYACEWGGKEESGEQSVYFTSAAEGKYDLQSRMWNGEPHKLIAGKIKMPHPGHSSKETIQSVAKKLDSTPSSPSSSSSSFKVETEILHLGEITNIAQCDGKRNLVATQTHAPDVYLWDMKAGASEAGPLLTLLGHEDTGSALRYYRALCFSSKDTILISGGSDQSVCLWSLEDITNGTVTSNGSRKNVKEVRSSSHKNGGGENVKNEGESRSKKRQRLLSTSTSSPTLQCRERYQGHRGVIRDLAFDCTNPRLFVSVGDDQHMLLWDRRIGTKYAHRIAGLHDCPILSVDWDPLSGHFIATGSQDGVVRVCDVRKLIGNGLARKKCIVGKSHDTKASLELVKTLQGHTGPVFGVQWNPTQALSLASCSSPGQLCLWDLGYIDDEGSRQQQFRFNVRKGLNDGFQPELMFRHVGIQGTISSFRWNPEDVWSLATTTVIGNPMLGSAHSGMLTFWRPTRMLTI
mmetsp:Transcript_5975/g.14450  ORF Transcript_5975/g.14450 Transcript_5975/m.14450 type:complete len:494 (-) Transcript_5975:181-1662(-)|eukprot:CAMPEP_0114522052 /NCGR_PEP_ID=MMETSP0109-20121206/20537_1 /TAXON_ID=29199 /ORGANISM="Chlorarachnion reptans, Strain CCCM449" /LENGTH=493 /DNA_ID=CAMNT_0001703245 /DNA_START=264 /DNA_END=1745 /DNA_ORIENTATION=+